MWPARLPARAACSSTHCVVQQVRKHSLHIDVQRGGSNNALTGDGGSSGASGGCACAAYSSTEWLAGHQAACKKWHGRQGTSTTRLVDTPRRASEWQPVTMPEEGAAVVSREGEMERMGKMNMTCGPMYSVRVENDPGRDHCFPSMPNWCNRIQG